MPSICVSKSGSLPREYLWPASRLRDEFGLHSVMLDADFRFLQDPFAVHEGWQEQFSFTRDCNAMVVLLDPSQWTSEGQDVESQDASGRGVPLAMCKVAPFDKTDDNERFSRLVSRGAPKYLRWSLLGYFDLCSTEEFTPLVSWLKRVVSVPPPRIQSVFQSNVSTPFAARIRVPGADVWDYMDWSSAQTLPNLVFNYGERLVRDERKARRQWEWPEKNQAVIPLASTAVRGELVGAITLPHRGFGHALVTFGTPDHIWRGEAEDRIMWWDFFVDID
jgi:hypothetical protein